MMKKPLLLSLFIFIYLIHANAQTIVSTEAENKNVVLEDYTGINCGYCPNGHTLAQAIKDEHPEDVVLINIHQGGLAVPQGGWPDYRTHWGDSLAEQANISAYPMGTINRHVFSGSHTGMGRENWSSTSNQILAQESYLNVACEATVIAATRQLMVLVEVYYTGDSPVSSNFLNVALIQNNVIGYQTGDYNYNHMHMLRHLLTGQWGEEIMETTAGSFYSTVLYYDIPEDYRDIPVVLENIEVSAFVSEDHQEIISGSTAETSFIAAFNLDAGIIETKIPQSSCGDFLEAEVMIKNYGSESLTSFDLEYSVNDGDIQNYSWSGSLTQLETVTVTLPGFEIITNESNQFDIILVNPNSAEDELPQNNIATDIFSKAEYAPQYCKLALFTDQNPEETTWDIKNSAGDIIAQGGPYSSQNFYLVPFTWPETDCYQFTIYDAGENGIDGGFYRIIDSNNDIIWEGNNDFGISNKTEFAFDELMNIDEVSLLNRVHVYPNPVIETAHIEFSLLQQSHVRLDVYNIFGNRVIEVFEGSLLEGNFSFDINSAYLPDGIYFVHLIVKGQAYTQKINVIKK